MDVGILMVFLHIIFAIIWTGSLIALPLLFIPVLKNDPRYDHYIDRIGYRLRKVGWFSLTAMLITGLYLLLDRDLYRNSLMNIKLIIFALLVLITFIHDWLGPKMGKSALNRILGRIMLLMTIFIIFLAVAMLRGVVL